MDSSILGRLIDRRERMGRIAPAEAPGLPPTKIWNADFVSIFVTNMLMQLGQQMMNTLIAKYVHSLGATATTVGFVTSLFAYTALAFKIVSAPAIDAFKKKWILTIAILVLAAAYGGYSLSATIGSLMVFRLLQGAGQAFTATTCLALASDALPRDRMGTGIGYYSVAQAICQAIGPTVGLALSGSIGYRPTFAICAALMIVAAVQASRIKAGSSAPGKAFAISLRGVIAKEALLPGLIMLFLSLAYANINAFLVIYAGERGADAHIGYFFTVYALTLLVSRPLIGRLADKFGIAKVLIPAMLCFALAFLMISVSASLPMFLISAFISAFGYGACQPAVQTLCMKSVPPERRGAGSSTNYIGQDLGQLGGPVIAGAVAESLGYASMWRVMIIPIIAAIAVVLLSRDVIRRAGNGANP